MAQLLVRDLSPETVERLKDHAEQNGRSLQGEVKAILESVAATPTMSEARRIAEEWHRRLAGRMTSDSADLIREDRDR
jgi:plasmid stability protein